MKYDFTSHIDRVGKDSIAVQPLDVEGLVNVGIKDGYDIIPMWVADMNFATAPSVTQAIIERAEHMTYGYFPPRQEYYDAIVNWHKNRNQVLDLDEACIGYENSVLGAVSNALNVLGLRGDKVLVHSPTYLGFTKVLKNNGYDIVLSPLKIDKNGKYIMDLEDMEEKIIKHKIHTTIFCSPHNPSGRVWSKKEILEAMELFRKYDVKVISDEIWSDILLDGNKHTPTQSVSEDAKNRTIAVYAPSKTFNLAGLIGAYHIIYNRTLRDKVKKSSSLSHYNMMNLFSMHSLIGAYSNVGSEWVDELCKVLSNNVNYAVDYINNNFKNIRVTKPEGTYLIFLDCSDWCQKNERDLDYLLGLGHSVGVIWQDGRQFNGSCHIRMNLALPFSRVKEAFRRLSEVLDTN